MEEKEIKKEIQEKIIPLPSQNGKVAEEELFNVLKMVSPGTNLRAALDGALKAGKGALIVIENDLVPGIMDGGFKINTKFTPQKLVELSKMDGAIILSKDVKKINFANVLLTPESKIKTSETGTRHKAAERTAKQTGTLVIAISERKHEIHLFYKNVKHLIKNADELLRKANGHIQILEKQREIFDHYTEKLNEHELRNYPSLNQAVSVIQKGKIIQMISKDLKRYLVELGTEGTLLKARLKELTSGVERETNLVMQDYTKLDLKKSKVLLDSLSYDEVLDPENILRVLAYESSASTSLVKGWRILSKTSLDEPEIGKLLKEMGSLGKTIYSNPTAYKHLIGEEKSQIFKSEIDKIKLSIDK